MRFPTRDLIRNITGRVSSSRRALGSDLTMCSKARRRPLEPKSGGAASDVFAPQRRHEGQAWGARSSIRDAHSLCLRERVEARSRRLVDKASLPLLTISACNRGRSESHAAANVWRSKRREAKATRSDQRAQPFESRHVASDTRCERSGPRSRRKGCREFGRETFAVP